MILNSLDKQFALAENGQITWQKDLTNPMPGEVVAEIKKGETILSPTCSLVDSPATEEEDKDAVLKHLSDWLGRYIKQALEPLFNLKADDVPEGGATEIAQIIFDSLGVVPRADLQSLISNLDEEKRNALRPKKIRFGPLLVYLPELNKPAAVRLRALLLTLWNDKDLPAEVPADGIVSFSVEGKDLDSAYYQAIGYPIYGPRSVRVDMLDRVICAVYDSAKEGKFQAQHQMAEWLGSNIADLYAVLEAMGHKKIEDPADQPEVEAKEVEEKQSSENKEGEQQEKPTLATFLLKKGKATDQKRAPVKNKKFDKVDFSSSKKKFKKSTPKKPKRERVYTAEAESKPEDSPFAILQQLKVADKE